MLSRPAPALLLLSLYLLLAISGARGQQRGLEPQSPHNLQEGLEQTAWDPRTKGVLLAIAPGTVTPPTVKQRQISIPPPERQGYGLPTLAGYFGQRVVRLPTLTVIAPAEMTLLRVPPGKPDPLVGMNRTQRARLLQISLTDAQWQQMGSERGIGADDLTPEQRALFLSLLPSPMVFHPGRVVGNGLRFGGPGSEADRGVTLGEAERAAVRLRINRTTHLASPPLSTDIRTGGETVPIHPHPEGAKLYALMGDHDAGERERLQNAQRFQEVVPSRRKPGHLDVRSPSLDPLVSLEGAKTLGDLIRRVATTTGLELVADPRIAALPLWIKAGGNEGVRAGDLLDALAWGVTGTYRKVGPLFLLTDDVEGIGTRRARIAEWVREAKELQRQWEETAKEKMRSSPVLSYLSFAPGDRMAPPPALLEKIEQGWSTPSGRGRGQQVPLSQLTPFQQEFVRSQLEARRQRPRIAESQSADSSAVAEYDPYPTQAVRTDRVWASIRTSMTLLVPRVGEVDASNDFDSLNIEDFLPQITVPDPEDRVRAGPVKLLPSMKAGAMLLVSPQSAKEAEEVAAVAGERGVAQLWILPPATAKGAGAREILSAAVAAGKRHGLPVYAVVRLMTAPPPTAPDAAGGGNTANPVLSDTTILGETGTQWTKRYGASPPEHPGVAKARRALLEPADWLQPGDARTLGVVKARLRDAASISDLAGLVLRDTAAPGYILENPATIGDQWDGQFGYTEALRLACIRRNGFDPIDMEGHINDAETPPPFSGRGFPGWGLFRRISDRGVASTLPIEQTGKCPGRAGGMAWCSI